MIRYNSLCALRIVAAHSGMPVTKLVQLLAGRVLPIVANTIARPAIDELLSLGLAEVWESSTRMIGLTAVGLRYLRETEISCAQQVA